MWLVYLRFEDEGKVKTYHVSADNKVESFESKYYFQQNTKWIGIRRQRDAGVPQPLADNPGGCSFAASVGRSFVPVVYFFLS